MTGGAAVAFSTPDTNESKRVFGACAEGGQVNWMVDTEGEPGA